MKSMEDSVQLLHMYCKKHKTQKCLVVVDRIVCEECYKEWENKQ